MPLYNMGKKVIISESTMKALATQQILNEVASNKSEIEKIVKDTIKNDSSLKKDMDKNIKDLVAKCVNKLFMTLWQRRNFYEDEIRK